MNKFWARAIRTIKIVTEALHTFLNENGFFTYRPIGSETKILVKVKDKRVKQVRADDLRQFCWDYIDKDYQFADPSERTELKDEFTSTNSPFSPANIFLLKETKFSEVKDTKDKSYLFFNNCYLEISAEKISKLNYTDQANYVWEGDVSEHDFTASIPEKYSPDGEFYELVKDLTKHEKKDVEIQNLESLITIIGYISHRYKDPANSKAIILMDTYLDGNPNGGTGKGVFTKCFEHIRKVAFIDGKRFQPSDRFSFANVKYGTRILWFDDIAKDFKFERIFAVITEKMTIERKGDNLFTIPFHESPKVVLTTNYSVEGSGDSHKRRKVEFIFSDTYNANYSPEDRFGHLLYENWDQTEWDKFFLFMAYCLQMFLLEGLIMPRFNVAERILKMTASKEFIDFAINVIDLDEKINKEHKYEVFLILHPEQTIGQNKFTRWLKLFAEAYGYNMIESHSGSDNYFEFNTQKL